MLATAKYFYSIAQEQAAELDVENFIKKGPPSKPEREMF